ncbi:MAG: Gx transporter family protein [Burkholderiales bacterium]|nr:Gx transporter family protein [Burkholderiales bacterium]
MIRSTIEIAATREDHHIARMAALAIGLSLADAAIPLPVPGIKPGFANIVVLIVLARYGMGTAIWVSILRVLGGSLLFGSFLSPGFFLSFCGALCSLTALFLAGALPQRWFGAVSRSIIAAFAHIAGQLALAYFWLIPNVGLFALVPFFALAALVFGTVNGLVSARFLEKVEAAHRVPIQCVHE